MAQPVPSAIRSKLNLSRFAITHSGLTICCWIAIAVAGAFAFSSLKYALLPDITFPVVIVNATAPVQTALVQTAPAQTAPVQTAPAQTALESETVLTIPLEEKLQSLEGLMLFESSISAGRSVTTLRFQPGTSLAASTTAVEQTIEETIAAAELPADADYDVIPLNLNEATAISYALSSETLTLAALADLAEAELLPPLQEISSVLRVDLLGAGLDDLPDSDLPDSASPERALQAPPTLTRFDRQPAIALQIVKRPTANTLEVVDQVKAKMQQLEAGLPQVDIAIATTQADYIRAATQATIDALMAAVVIAVLVIFAFLRSWQATLIAALAIPLSLLGTCIVMAIYGFNLETITLLGLALVIGITVDDAIVEIENIIRHMELGASPREAALIATQEIELSVSVSTLTIAAVFLPVAFMGGTVGQFFKPFGLTVSAAVLVSLLVARTLTPVLAVRWLKVTHKADDSGAIEGVISEGVISEGVISEGVSPADATQASIAQASTTQEAATQKAEPDSRLERAYRQLLSWALRHRWAVVGIAIASLIAGIAIIPLIPQGFIPQLDRGEFYLNYTVALPDVSAPPPSLGSAQLPSEEALSAADGQTAPPLDASRDLRRFILQETLDRSNALEAAVYRLPAVKSVFTTVGDQGRPNQGRLHITLSENREQTTAAAQAQLRQSLTQIKDASEESIEGDLTGDLTGNLTGVTTSVEDVPFVDTGGEKPLQVALLGDDLEVLNQAAIAVKQAVEKRPGFVDIRISGDENTATEIVEINHRRGERAVYISANLLPGKALGEATNDVTTIAQSVMPPGVRTDLGSDSARAGEVLGSFGRTLTLAVICMLVVIFLPFGRLLEPLVVGLSLPLSVVGAMLALLVTRSDFGVISLLGLLFLLGLLDKNALLLLDYANQLRRKGMQRTDAILQTGLVRLRPILMTTASTVLGMLPLALKLGTGAELRQPMAVAIIGGLLTSTLLSLIVVPVLYALLEDGWQQVSRLWRGGRRQSSHASK